MTDIKAKPKVNSQGMQELDKAQEQLDQFNAQVKDLVENRAEMRKPESEQVTNLSQKEIKAFGDKYLKPVRAISSRESFNEKYRDQYNFMKQYVQFIAEHKEMQGEVIEKWTKPFAGMPAEFWSVPTGTPVWGPRYLAEEIKNCKYHRLKMKDVTTGADGAGQYYGQLAADIIVQRLDAYPVNQSRSIFMGPEGN